MSEGDGQHHNGILASKKETNQTEAALKTLLRQKALLDGEQDSGMESINSQPADSELTTIKDAQDLHRLIDNATLNKNHWKIWFLCAMGVFIDGFDLFIIGVALPLIAQDLSPNRWEIGMIGAAAPLGAMFGAAALGWATDKIGRKTMYMFDLVLFVVLSIVCSLSWNAFSLIAFRFLLGIGIGADYPIGSSYIAEFMPSKVRGKMLISAFSFQAVGSLAGALVGLAVLMVYPEVSAWRWMLAIGVVPAVATIFMRHSAPESPRWLLDQGRVEEACKVVGDTLGQELSFTSLNLPKRPERAAKAKISITALFEKSYLRRTILALAPWFLMDIALYGVGIFTPTMLAAIVGEAHPLAFHTVSQHMIHKDIIATEGAIFLDAFLVVGFVLSIISVEKFGRIKLQMCGFIGMTIGLIILAIAVAIPTDPNHLLLVFCGFALFNLLVNIGPNATTYLLPAELFPTKLRATGHGLASAAGKIGAVFGIFFLPVLMSTYGLSTTMSLVAATSFLGFLGTWIFGVETTGVALEDASKIGVTER